MSYQQKYFELLIYFTEIVVYKLGCGASIYFSLSLRLNLEINVKVVWNCRKNCDKMKREFEALLQCGWVRLGRERFVIRLYSVNIFCSIIVLAKCRLANP